jgi:Holliday junction resolvase-like predicted endonuclease
LFSFDDIHRNDENKIVFVEVQTRASSFMHFWQGSISYLLIL